MSEVRTEPAVVSAGVFDIQSDKKSPPVTKTAKHVGMIAGGTGELEKLKLSELHQHEGITSEAEGVK